METTQRAEEIEAPMPESLPAPTEEDARVYEPPVDEAPEAEEPPILAQEAPTMTTGVVTATVGVEEPAGGGEAPTATPAEDAVDDQPPVVEETEVAALTAPEEEARDLLTPTAPPLRLEDTPEIERGEEDTAGGLGFVMVGLTVLTVSLAVVAGFAWRSRRR